MLFLSRIKVLDLHEHRTFLSPYALGSVLWFDICGHSILHYTGDVLLDNVGTEVPVMRKETHQNQILKKKKRDLISRVTSFMKGS